MKRVPFFLFILLLSPLGVLFNSCGSSEDTSREASWTDSTAQTRRTEFETKTDTVTLQRTSPHKDPGDLQNPGRLQYMVQIGSYTESKNASTVQSRARKRFQRPVVKEYSTAKRRYQIRIGFFDTELAAKEFRLRLIKEFPEEYKGAWVVRVNK